MRCRARLWALVAATTLGCSTPPPAPAPPPPPTAPALAFTRSDLDALDHARWHIATGQKGVFTVAWQPVSGELLRNEALDLDVLVFRGGRTVPDATVQVRGFMPEHNHGFVQKPVMEGDGQAFHVARGVLFHMRGFWQFYVDVSSGGERDTVLFELHL